MAIPPYWLYLDCSSTNAGGKPFVVNKIVSHPEFPDGNKIIFIALH
jgi:hypothetical protein